MKILIMVSILLTGCAMLLTPEQRAEINRSRAYSLSAGQLCYSINMGKNVPYEVYEVARERGINCSSSEMLQLTRMVQEQKNIERQEAQKSPFDNVFDTSRQPVQCTTFGNRTTCY